MLAGKNKIRLIHAMSFLVIFVIEVIIALYVKDDFIRPYGGDILVTVLLCSFVRIFFPYKPALLPLFVFIFSVMVEIGQYFDIVSLLGLDEIAFFRILIGTSFSFIDILCYALGCLIFFLAEKIVLKKVLG